MTDESYYQSDEYKRQLKLILICMAVLIVFAVVVAILKTPHYTAEQLDCIARNPMNKYLCGVQ